MAKSKNDVTEVFIPVTGKIAIAPAGTPVPTPEQGKAKSLEINEAFVELGLLTQDGGFEMVEEATGEPLEFFQQGYSMPSGEGSAQLTLTLAQTSRAILQILRGRQFDEHYHMVVDAAGNPIQYVVWTEEIGKNGAIRRRCGENVKVMSAKAGKAERGTVNGTEVTFSFLPAAGHPDGHYHEWMLTASELAG